MSLRIRKNDEVIVIQGRHKGQRGRVLYVDPKRQRAIVEGVNFVTRHQKARSQTEPAGRIQKEAPIHLSNLALIDPETGKPTRFRVRINPDGSKDRIAVKSGKVIPVRSG